MTQLIIDTSDDPAVIRAARNMLNELLGEAALVVVRDELVGKQIDDEGAGAASTGTRVRPIPATKPDTRKDPQGVIFDPEFCGEATEPFYGSGKRAGQWKKKRGVGEAEYDAWYATQLAALAAGNTASEDEQINTAGAFGGGGEDSSQPAGDPAPEDCGAFMGWVSAKQAAGLLTQDDIGDAYVQASVQVTDLFPPNDEDTVKQNVATLYQILVVKAGA